MNIIQRCWVSLFLIGMTQLAQAAWMFNVADLNALHYEAADYKIAYGTDPMQYGELRLPLGATPPYPVVILLHGGCWQTQIATASNIAALADALRGLGYATWNVEYRSADDAGGGWPGTFNDVASATDFLRTIAGQYSLDLKHVVVIGHSAGGHLALWLAARHQLPAKSQLHKASVLPLSGVVTIGGIPDLQAFREHGKRVCGSDVVASLLGKNEKNFSARYQQSSPKELLPLGVPQILIYGSEDQIAPAQLGEDYKAVAIAKGDTVNLVMVPDGGHFEYNVPNSMAWPAIKTAIQSLLNNQAK